MVHAPVPARRLRAGALAPLAALALAAACAGVPAEPDALRGLPSYQVALPDSVAAAYRRDAVALAVRELRRGRAPERQQVEVPAELVESLYGALGAVYGAAGLPARDSVVELYRVHTFPETQQLIVGLDTAAAWTRAWARGELATGERAVDDLVRRYGLTLERYYPWLSGHAAVLEATRPLNVVALAPAFAGVRGVRYAEPNAFGGDGNDIRARAEGGGWVLEYSVAWGDCPAGCISRRTWTFAVDRDGAVTYRGSRGDPAPAPGVR